MMDYLTEAGHHGLQARNPVNYVFFIAIAEHGYADLEYSPISALLD